MRLTCPVCKDLLGLRDKGPDGKHALCAWATPADWRALRPFFVGDFQGVSAGGE